MAGLGSEAAWLPMELSYRIATAWEESCDGLATGTEGELPGGWKIATHLSPFRSVASNIGPHRALGQPLRTGSVIVTHTVRCM
jgi:hypothetical protein